MNSVCYHLGVTSEDIGRYVLLPGDPGRCEKIAAYLDTPRHVAQNREFNIYTGMLSGVPVSVCSTGIGSPSAAIAIEELFMCGADTFIRVGTCGGISTAVCPGDIVIASASTRQDGTSREYAPIEYPAAANFSVCTAIVDAAKKFSLPYHVGVVQSKDSFYGQHEPHRMPVESELIAKWEAWKRLGVLASEMESAALFVVGASLGARCGALFHTVWNQERKSLGLDRESVKNEDTDAAIRTAVEAIEILIEQD